jgi:hypothetical protein
MQTSRIQRLKFIAELIQQASIPSPENKKGNKPKGANELIGITFKDIQDSVSNHFELINDRQLRNDIAILRNEGYDGIPLNIKIKKSRYFLKENLGLNQVRFTDEEKATMPFVVELLTAYKDIPAVNLILNTLVNQEIDFKFDEKVGKVVEFGSPTVNMKSDVAKRIQKFLLAIQQQYAVVFNYTNVRSGASSDPRRREEESKEQQIYPLQIRSHLGRFYVVGALFKLNPSPADIRIFAIDAIVRGPDKHEIDTPFDENEKLKGQEVPHVDFEWRSLVLKTGLKDYYTHSIGLYRNYLENEKPIAVLRWFTGWAANWVKEFPIHGSQQQTKIDEYGNIRIKIEVYDTPDLKNFFARFGDNCLTDEEYAEKYP